MSRSQGRQPVDYYLDLRYPVVVHQDPEGGYVAEIPDLPGCATQAETPAELFEMIEDARRVWIEATYEDGREIPLPRSDQVYSGRFVVRMPASLHRQLADAAEAETVSLNQYVVSVLSAGVSLDLVARRVEERLDHLAERLAVPDQPSRPVVGAFRVGERTALVKAPNRGRRGKQNAPKSRTLPKDQD